MGLGSSVNDEFAQRLYNRLEERDDVNLGAKNYEEFKSKYLTNEGALNMIHAAAVSDDPAHAVVSRGTSIQDFNDRILGAELGTTDIEQQAPDALPQVSQTLDTQTTEETPSIDEIPVATEETAPVAQPEVVGGAEEVVTPQQPQQEAVGGFQVDDQGLTAMPDGGANTVWQTPKREESAIVDLDAQKLFDESFELKDTKSPEARLMERQERLAEAKLRTIIPEAENRILKAQKDISSLTNDEETQLTPDEQQAYYHWWNNQPDIQEWKAQYRQHHNEEPLSTGYDFKGAYLAGITPKPSEEVDAEGNPIYEWANKGLHGKELRPNGHEDIWKDEYTEMFGTNPDELNIGREEGELKISNEKRKLLGEEMAKDQGGSFEDIATNEPIIFKEEHQLDRTRDELSNAKALKEHKDEPWLADYIDYFKEDPFAQGHTKESAMIQLKMLNPNYDPTGLVLTKETEEELSNAPDPRSQGQILYSKWEKHRDNENTFQINKAEQAINELLGGKDLTSISIFDDNKAILFKGLIEKELGENFNLSNANFQAAWQNFKAAKTTQVAREYTIDYKAEKEAERLGLSKSGQDEDAVKSIQRKLVNEQTDLAMSLMSKEQRTLFYTLEHRNALKKEINDLDPSSSTLEQRIGLQEKLEDLNEKIKAINENPTELYDIESGKYKHADQVKDKTFASTQKKRLAKYKEMETDQLVSLWNQKLAVYQHYEKLFDQKLDVAVNDAIIGQSMHRKVTHKTVSMSARDVLEKKASYNVDGNDDDKNKKRLLDRRDAYLRAKQDVMDLNQMLMLNQDPAGLKTFTGGLKREGGGGFFESIGESMAEAVVGEFNTDADIAKNSIGMLKEAGVTLSKEQEEIFEDDLSTSVAEGIGTSIPVMAEIIVSSMVGAPMISAVSKFSKANKAMRIINVTMNRKWGKGGRFIYNTISGGLEGALVFGMTPSESVTGAMGFGEGAAGKIVDGLNIGEKLGGKWAKLINVAARVAGGTTTETFSEYAGEFTDELSKNGYNWGAAFDKTIGEGATEQQRKFYTTGIISLMFSTAFNLKVGKVAINSLKDTKAPTEMVQSLEKLYAMSSGNVASLPTDTERGLIAEVTEKQERLDQINKQMADAPPLGIEPAHVKIIESHISEGKTLSEAISLAAKTDIKKEVIEDVEEEVIPQEEVAETPIEGGEQVAETTETVEAEVMQNLISEVDVERNTLEEVAADPTTPLRQKRYQDRLNQLNSDPKAYFESQKKSYEESLKNETDTEAIETLNSRIESADRALSELNESSTSTEVSPATTASQSLVDTFISEKGKKPADRSKALDTTRTDAARSVKTALTGTGGKNITKEQADQLTDELGLEPVKTNPSGTVAVGKILNAVVKNNIPSSKLSEAIEKVKVGKKEASTLSFKEMADNKAALDSEVATANALISEGKIDEAGKVLDGVESKLGGVSVDQASSVSRAVNISRSNITKSPEVETKVEPAPKAEVVEEVEPVIEEVVEEVVEEEVNEELEELIKTNAIPKSLARKIRTHIRKVKTALNPSLKPDTAPATAFKKWQDLKSDLATIMKDSPTELRNAVATIKSEMLKESPFVISDNVETVVDGKVVTSRGFDLTEDAQKTVSEFKAEAKEKAKAKKQMKDQETTSAVLKRQGITEKLKENDKVVLKKDLVRNKKVQAKAGETITITNVTDVNNYQRYGFTVGSIDVAETREKAGLAARKSKADKKVLAPKKVEEIKSKLSPKNPKLKSAKREVDSLISHDQIQHVLNELGIKTKVTEDTVMSVQLEAAGLFDTQKGIDETMDKIVDILKKNVEEVQEQKEQVDKTVEGERSLIDGFLAEINNDWEASKQRILDLETQIKENLPAIQNAKNEAAKKKAKAKSRKLTEELKEERKKFKELDAQAAGLPTIDGMLDSASTLMEDAANEQDFGGVMFIMGSAQAQKLIKGIGKFVYAKALAFFKLGHIPITLYKNIAHAAGDIANKMVTWTANILDKLMAKILMTPSVRSFKKKVMDFVLNMNKKTSYKSGDVDFGSPSSARYVGDIIDVLENSGNTVEGIIGHLEHLARYYGQAGVSGLTNDAPMWNAQGKALSQLAKEINGMEIKNYNAIKKMVRNELNPETSRFKDNNVGIVGRHQSRLSKLAKSDLTKMMFARQGTIKGWEAKVQVITSVMKDETSQEERIAMTLRLQGAKSLNNKYVLSDTKRAEVERLLVTPSENMLRYEPELDSFLQSARDMLIEFEILDESARDKGNYFPSIYDIKDFETGIYGNSQLGANTLKHAKKKSFETFNEGMDAGFVPQTLDAGELIQLYTKNVAHKVGDMNLVNSLIEYQMGDGKPIAMVASDPNVPKKWAKNTIKGSNFKKIVGTKNGVKAVDIVLHPDAYAVLKGIVGETGGSTSKIGIFAAATNNMMKRANLQFSFFHHFALTETALGTPDTFMRALKHGGDVTKLFRAFKTKDFLAIAESEAFIEAVKHGLKVEASPDVSREMAESLLDKLEQGTKLTDKKIPWLGWSLNPTTAFKETQEKMDRFLWDYMHNNYKLVAYQALEADGIQMVNKKYPNASDAQIEKALREMRQEAADQVNSTFGGQNWELMGTSPKFFKQAQMMLLSPDWTISTARQALSPLSGLKHSRTARILKMNGERGDMVSQSLSWAGGKIDPSLHASSAEMKRKWGYRFWARTVLMYHMGQQMLNFGTTYLLGDRDDEGNRQGRFMWDNPIGHRLTSIFLGRRADGSERYIKLGKQMTEVPELYEDLGGRLASKTAPFMQGIYATVFGETISGFSVEEEEDTSVGGMVRRGALMFGLGSMPFSVQSIIKEQLKMGYYDKHATWGDKVAGLFFPITKGLSSYKFNEGMEKAIKNSDVSTMEEYVYAAKMNNIPVDFKKIKSQFERVYREKEKKVIKDSEFENVDDLPMDDLIYLDTYHKGLQTVMEDLYWELGSDDELDMKFWNVPPPTKPTKQQIDAGLALPRKLTVE